MISTGLGQNVTFSDRVLLILFTLREEASKLYDVLLLINTVTVLDTNKVPIV